MEEHLGRGFDQLTPELARNARKALGMSHRRLGQAIGERAAVVMRFELGKEVDESVVEKLRTFFQRNRIRVTREGLVGRYQT